MLGCRLTSITLVPSFFVRSSSRCSPQQALMRLQFLQSCRAAYRLGLPGPPFSSCPSCSGPGSTGLRAAAPAEAPPGAGAGQAGGGRGRTVYKPAGGLVHVIVALNEHVQDLLLTGASRVPDVLHHQLAAYIVAGLAALRGGRLPGSGSRGHGCRTLVPYLPLVVWRAAFMLQAYRLIEVLKGMGPLSLAAATDILESSKSCLVSQALCAPALSVWLNCRWPAEAPMHMQAPCRHATCPQLVALGAPCRAAPRRAAPHRKARGVCTCAAIVGGDMPRIIDEIPRRHAASILLLTEHTAAQHLFARCQYSH